MQPESKSLPFLRLQNFILTSCPHSNANVESIQLPERFKRRPKLDLSLVIVHLLVIKIKLKYIPA